MVVGHVLGLGLQDVGRRGDRLVPGGLGVMVDQPALVAAQALGGLVDRQIGRGVRVVGLGGGFHLDVACRMDRNIGLEQMPVLGQHDRRFDRVDEVLLNRGREPFFDMGPQGVAHIQLLALDDDFHVQDGSLIHYHGTGRTRPGRPPRNGRTCRSPCQTRCLDCGGVPFHRGRAMARPLERYVRIGLILPPGRSVPVASDRGR